MKRFSTYFLLNNLKICIFTFLAVAMLAVTSVPSFAQVKEGSNLEIGGGYNLSFFKNSSGNNRRIPGPGAFLEYRYAMLSGSIDLGVQINWKYASKPADYDDAELAYDINYNNVGLKTVFDYNILPQRLVNPFVGIGAGFGMTFVHRTDADGIRIFGTFSPRVGVQIWRIRFTCDFDLMSRWTGISSSGFNYRAYSSILAFNLGYSF